MVSPILIVVLVLIVGIWLIVEFRRFNHKILAVFLIILILFTYFSFSAVIKGKGLDLKTANGIKEAGKLYLLWLGHAFSNVKVITSNVIGMDWKGNETIGNVTSISNGPIP